MNILTPLMVVPIICFRFGNWLLLFGSLFIWLGEAIGSHKATKFRIFIVVIIGSFAYWSNEGFNIHNELTFYFICFFFGFLCYQLYRAIGFGDRISRAKIAAQGNLDATGEITEEIAQKFDKARSGHEKTLTPRSDDKPLDSKLIWDIVKKYSDRPDFSFEDAVKSASSELGISETYIVARISEPDGATELIEQLKENMDERKRAHQEALDWIKPADHDS